MKILIAGGTGFIGNALTEWLVDNAYEVNVLSRKQLPDCNGVHHYLWNVDNGYIDPIAFEGVEAIINLTGANIGESRWTANRKQTIIDSRVKALALLRDSVSKYGHEIEVLISSSAVGYYGAVTTDKVFSEDDDSGDDFLSDVCRRWEDEAYKFEPIVGRVVILRKGVVLAPGGGMMKKLKPLARLGINVAMGTGQQYLPWICMKDLLEIYCHILHHSSCRGVYNAVSSEHITMNEFSIALLKSYGCPNWLPNVSSWAVRMLVGEMSAMLLEGSRVSNEKIKSEGFTFEYPIIDQCLKR